MAAATGLAGTVVGAPIGILWIFCCGLLVES